MALWDTVENIFSGGGKGDIDRGYNESRQYMNPYYYDGQNNYQQLQDFTSSLNRSPEEIQKEIDALHANGMDVGRPLYNTLNLSPENYYHQIMGGYSESPEAKFAQEKAFEASSRGASASGMLGSGAFQKALQENANDISQRDRGQYFQDVMGTGQQQLAYLNNYQTQEQRLRDELNARRMMYGDNLRYLTGLGYNAGSDLGRSSIDQGNARAQIGRQTIGDLFSLGGMAAGYGMGMPPANNQIPLYARKAMGIA